MSVTDINQRLIDDNRPITLLKCGNNTNDISSRWQCHDCGHEWNSRIGSVVTAGTGCPPCKLKILNNSRRLTIDIITQRLIDNNRHVTLLHYGSDSQDSSSRWECHDCGHEWNTTANSVLSGGGVGTGCTKCGHIESRNKVRSTIEDIKQHLLDNDIPITVLSYGSSMRDNSTLWECHDCGHEWNTSAGGVINKGTGCPQCADYGYNPGKPGHFYLHTYSDFIKIGITNRLERRKAQLNNQLINETLYSIESSLSWSFENGGDAAIVESMVLEAFSGRQYTGLMGTTFDGRTELLDISLHDELIDLMAKVMG
jgi:transposase-like protein